MGVAAEFDIKRDDASGDSEFARVMDNVAVAPRSIAYEWNPIAGRWDAEVVNRCGEAE